MSTNPFRRLLELLPQSPLTVATVAAVHTDGTVSVTYPGGSQIRVRGGGGVIEGDQVFVRNSVIEDIAPSLAFATIEV